MPLRLFCQPNSHKATDRANRAGDLDDLAEFLSGRLGWAPTEVYKESVAAAAHCSAADNYAVLLGTSAPDCGRRPSL